MSRFEFDHEFNKTFVSVNSARHLSLFDQFFAGLTNYYSEYQVNLKDIIRKLFANVVRMTLSLADPKHQSSFSSPNLDDSCLDEFVLDSDVRMEIERKLECALESVRLFSASLTRLRDIIIEFYVKLDTTSSSWSKACLAELTQIYSCSMCLSDQVMSPKRAVRPCYHSCLNVYKNCISFDFNKFDSAWNLYISKYKFDLIF